MRVKTTITIEVEVEASASRIGNTQYARILSDGRVRLGKTAFDVGDVALAWCREDIQNMAMEALEREARKILSEPDVMGSGGNG